MSEPAFSNSICRAMASTSKPFDQLGTPQEIKTLAGGDKERLQIDLVLR
jgi:hypothetical protein